MATTRVSEQAASSVYSGTLTHDVPSGASLAVAFVKQVLGQTNAAPTLGGVAMQPIANSGLYGYGQNYVSLWQLPSPAAGSQVFNPNGTSVRGFAIVCYAGGDTTTPIRATPVVGTATDDSVDPSVVVPSDASDLTLMAVGFGSSGGTLTGVAGGSGSTMIASVLLDNGGVALMEEAGGASVTLGADLTISALHHSGWIGVSIQTASTATVAVAGDGIMRMSGSGAIQLETLALTPTADRLSRIEVWRDYECAVGLSGRLAVLPAVIVCNRTRALQDVSALNVTIEAGSAGSDTLLEERVLRTVYVGGHYDEWRIKRIVDSYTDKGLVHEIEAAGPEQDLATKTVIERREADGSAVLDFELLGLTVREHFNATSLAALTAAGTSYWRLGTIDPTAPVDVVYAKSNPLEALRRIAAQTGAEWRVRRAAATGYVIDVVWQVGQEWTVAQIREGMNVQGIKRHRSSVEMMTRGHPVGSDIGDGISATMARNRWLVAAIVSTTVTLADPMGGDGPIAFDDQLNGLGVRRPGLASTGILDTIEATQSIVVESVANLAVGMLVEVALLVNDGDLTSLDSPVGVATYGVVARPIERPDIPGTVNLILNPTMRLWSSSDTTAPNGWAPIGGALLMRTTTPGLWRFGGQSCQVLGNGPGSGLRAPLVALTPTAARPYVIGYASAWLTSGAGRVELVALATAMATTLTYAAGVVTVTNSVDHGLSNGDRVEISGANELDYNGVWVVATVLGPQSFTYRITTAPSSPATGTPVTQRAWLIPDGTNGKALIQQEDAWADIWVTDQRLDFNTLGIVAVYLRIVQESATTLDCNVDAAQLTQSNLQEPFVEGSGPTQLWQECNRQLLLLSQPLVRYDVDVMNLAAADGAIWSRYAFGLGQIAALLSGGANINGQTRVVQLNDDLMETRLLGVSLSSRPEDVTDLLVRPPRPDRLPRGRPTDNSLSLQAYFRKLSSASVEARLAARPSNSRIKYQVLAVSDEVPEIGHPSYAFYSGPFSINQDQTEALVLAAYALDGNRVSAIQTWPVEASPPASITMDSTEASAGVLVVNWYVHGAVQRVRLYYRLHNTDWPTLDGTLTGILDEQYLLGTIHVELDGGSVARDGTPMTNVVDNGGTARTGIGGTSWTRTGLSNGNVVRLIGIPVDATDQLGARASTSRTITTTSSVALTAFTQSALTNSAGTTPTVGQTIYGNLAWTPNASVSDGSHDLEISISADGGAWEVLTTVLTPVTTTTLRVATPYTRATGKYDPNRALMFRARVMLAGVPQTTRVTDTLTITTRDAVL